MNPSTCDVNTAISCRVELGFVPPFYILMGPDAVQAETDGFDPIASEIHKGTGYHGLSLIRLALALTSPGQTIVDIGAHSGTFTLPLASGGRSVLAFEPAPWDVSYLRGSVQRNKFGHLIEVVAAAVSNQPSQLRIVCAGRYAHVAPENEAGGHEVPAIVAGPVINKLSTPVGLIRIDIEGFEVEGLAGMADWLRSSNGPPIIYESNHYWLGAHRRSAIELREALFQLGYQYHYLIRDGNRLTPIARADVQPELSPDLIATRTPLKSLPGWNITAPLTDDEFFAMVDTAITVPYPPKYLSSLQCCLVEVVLKKLPNRLMQDPRMASPASKLANSSDPLVRDAMKWYPRGVLLRMKYWARNTARRTVGNLRQIIRIVVTRLLALVKDQGVAR